MNINAALQVAQFLWDYKIPVVTTIAVITGIFIAKKLNADPLAGVVLKSQEKHPTELMVTTYNVLAQDYVFVKGDLAKPYSQYEQCDPAALNAEMRQQGLLQELQTSNADILCLQEVEEAFFKAAAEILQPLGYKGIYTKKAKKGALDGCAFFYKTSSVEEVLKEKIVYSDGSGHIAQVVILNYQGQYLGVVNTHLKWQEGDAFAKKELAQVLEAQKKRYRQVTSWIVCGDFNVEPSSSALEQLRAKGFTTTTTSTTLPTCKAQLEVNKVKSIQEIRPDYIFVSAKLSAEAEKIRDIAQEKILPTLTINSDHVQLSARVKRTSS